MSGLKEGILAIRKVKQMGLFVFYSVLIWGLYFLMFYFCFFCFEFTSRLGMMAGMTAFVFGSFGMVAPVQGGDRGLAFYGDISINALFTSHTGDGEYGEGFCLLTHGIMTFVYIVVGIVCLIALPLYNTARNK